MNTGLYFNKSNSLPLDDCTMNGWLLFCHQAMHDILPLHTTLLITQYPITQSEKTHAPPKD